MIRKSAIAFIATSALLASGCGLGLGPLTFAFGDASVTKDCKAVENSEPVCDETRGGTLSDTAGELLKGLGDLVKNAVPFG